MEYQNAFIGRKNPPTETEVSTALGASAATWQELIECLSDQGIVGPEWRSVSPKYGWGLRPALKKRTILYLGPCDGCFRVSFVLGDRAVAAARATKLPKNVLKAIDEARRYAEGTGVYLTVRKSSELAAIKKLVEIKLQN